MFSLRDFFEQTDANGTRTTALHPLLWGIGIFSAAITGILKAGAPDWLLVIVTALFFLCSVTFIGAYLYFMFKNPDALRSERFTLNKMAMERGFIGDDYAGLSAPPDPNIPLLGAQVTDEEHRS